MVPIVDPDAEAPQVSLGMAQMTAMGFRGENMAQLGVQLLDRTFKDPDDAAALLDVGMLHLLLGNLDMGLDYQRQALAKRQIFRDGTTNVAGDGLRLLALAAPGDLMANVPVSFLLEGSDIRLDTLYVVPGVDLPARVPEHDVAMVVVGESEANRPILERIAGFIDQWPRRPVLNDPRRTLGLSRDGVAANMAGAEGVCIPGTVRIDADRLARLAHGEEDLRAVLADGSYPLIVRPRDSHAGKGLLKIDDAAALAAYLQEWPTEEYYLSSFVDYSGADDGQFCKYRIALVDGRPYISHMAVSSRWMVHYLNADMKENQAKRDREAEAFATFDEDFARRHKVAFDNLCDRIGLDYFVIDCAETRDGRLLLFEVDTAMIVHAMDSREIYPYKAPKMHCIFRAFQDMLRDAAGRVSVG